jgi:hypothetical protein
MFAFVKFEVFIAVGPIIPFHPTLGKAVPAADSALGPSSGLQLKVPLIRSIPRSCCAWPDVLSSADPARLKAPEACAARKQVGAEIRIV